jgi:CsoR family transcriptional regulator, copper-sensing transcriptional repressor
MKKTMKKYKTTHAEQIQNLKKIEGQVRGLQRMVDEGRYCVDIITQIHSVIGALRRVESGIFCKHLKGCVAGAGASRPALDRKIDEIIVIFDQYKKI